MAGDEVTVYFNPSCSKCRTAHAILEEKGVDATYVRYLENARAARSWSGSWGCWASTTRGR